MTVSSKRSMMPATRNTRAEGMTHGVHGRNRGTHWVGWGRAPFHQLLNKLLNEGLKRVARPAAESLAAASGSDAEEAGRVNKKLTAARAPETVQARECSPHCL
uniref:Uncharacterized protein n=1 Tax=Eutreptiella gymnastica TaxID=73025 RepID=A0A7S4GJE7_9EUGL